MPSKSRSLLHEWPKDTLYSVYKVTKIRGSHTSRHHTWKHTHKITSITVKICASGQLKSLKNEGLTKVYVTF